MSDVEGIAELIGALADESVFGVPVRVMEALIAAGPAAVEPLTALVREVDPESDDWPALWAAVVLGELRAASAAPVLAEAMLKHGSDAVTFTVAAAEALGAIGAPALPALRSVAAAERECDRLWAYYAAGLMQGPAARDFLLTALDSDPSMLDVVALALADQGDSAVIERLYHALERAEAWQRSDVEDAIQALHLGSRAEGASPRDWRVRYRLNALFGRGPLNWAMITSFTREKPAVREKRTAPLRPLEQILEEAEADVDRCPDCGAARWQGTGVRVCPENAAAIPVIQADLLGKRREATGIDDLFEMLDDVEAELIELSDRPEARRKRKREEQQYELETLRAAQQGLIWAFEQGADSVGAARARLLAEGLRAAQEHGDPWEVFQRPGAPGQRADRRPGRNEPCPCGSGRKYKKCCGPREAAEAARPASTT